jgi:hypothetical protein
VEYEENDEVLDGEGYEEIDEESVKISDEARAETVRWARIDRKLREKIYGKKRR